jgi:Putative adhesin
MERNRRVAAWAGAAAGIALAVVLNVALAHAWEDDNEAVREEFHQTYPLARNGRIELENINGSVHISVWDQNQVKVEAVKRARDDKRLKNIEIRVNARPETISIETYYRDEGDDEWGRHVNPGSVEYTLTVPRTARLDEIKLINGALDVADVNGEVRASCINGKLTARGLGGRAKLETINGMLDAEFNHLQNPVDLSSVNGSLLLTLPSDAKASIEASTVHGGIDNDFGLHANNHHWVGHDLRGELGGGGTEISLHNVNGAIDVRHAKDGRAISPAKDIGERANNDDEI